jgi:hypothetical protein
LTFRKANLADTKAEFADTKANLTDMKANLADTKVEPADMKAKPADMKGELADMKSSSWVFRGNKPCKEFSFVFGINSVSMYKKARNLSEYMSKARS